jgi:hypothetical protein
MIVPSGGRRDRLLPGLGQVDGGVGRIADVVLPIRSYQPVGSDKMYYAIRNLGMTAWEIGADRWEQIGAELRQPIPPALDKPAGGLLLHYDEKLGTYDPNANAAFLFITREGAAGVLLVGVEVLDTNVRIGEPSRGEQAFNPVGFMKGRRFSFKIIEPIEDAK